MYAVYTLGNRDSQLDAAAVNTPRGVQCRRWQAQERPARGVQPVLVDPPTTARRTPPQNSRAGPSRTTDNAALSPLRSRNTATPTRGCLADDAHDHRQLYHSLGGRGTRTVPGEGSIYPEGEGSIYPEGEGSIYPEGEGSIYRVKCLGRGLVDSRFTQAFNASILDWPANWDYGVRALPLHVRVDVTALDRLPVLAGQRQLEPISLPGPFRLWLRPA